MANQVVVVSYRNSTSNHNVGNAQIADGSVVSYRNSTSNHNKLPITITIEGLYLIEILHQTTTLAAATVNNEKLYLIEILHQTTTFFTFFIMRNGCILSKFYIKPQQPKQSQHRTVSCILSKFYIKPQLFRWHFPSHDVVSYRNSTSNHNLFEEEVAPAVLYLIEILHQTTTPFFIHCFLCVVSYRNSTSNHNCVRLFCATCNVVSYRNSTSNHNFARSFITGSLVVSYRNSTSNHNWKSFIVCSLVVVSYRNSTSNHNKLPIIMIIDGLYLIEILHQTTTSVFPMRRGTLLYLIEILHQTTTESRLPDLFWSCILSKFYIKPQQPRSCFRFLRVVSYRNSTSNHNFASSANSLIALYLIEILHQTTTLPTCVHPRACCILSKFYIKPQRRVHFTYVFYVVSYRNSTSNHNTGVVTTSDS